MEHIILENLQSKHCTVDAVVLNDAVIFEEMSMNASSVKSRLTVYVWQDKIIPPNSPEVSTAQQNLTKFASEIGEQYSYGTGMATHELLAKGILQGSVLVSGDTDVSVLGAAGVLGLPLQVQPLKEVLETGVVDLSQYELITVGVQLGGLDVYTIAQLLKHQLSAQLKENAIIGLVDPTQSLIMRDRMMLCSWVKQWNVASILFIDVKQPDYTVDTSEVLQKNETVELPVAAVFIGGTCGGFLEDIEVVANALEGKHVAKGTRLSVSPATADIYIEAANKGYISTIIDAGGLVLNQCASPDVQARIGSGELMISSFCEGRTMALMGPGEIMLGTNNRNFLGRYGSAEAQAYLSSPAVAAASAITGYLTHPNQVV